MTRVLFVVLAVLAALGVAALASAAGKPPAPPNNPVINFVSPSPAIGAGADTDGDMTFASTYNRTPKQTAISSLTCAVSGQAAVSVACATPVAFPSNSKTDSKSGAVFTDLANGAYTFTFTLRLTGGGVYTASRSFTVAVPQPNSPPVANSASVSTDEDTAKGITSDRDRR